VTEALVYLNGRMVPASEARLPVYDAGVVLGATVSEMARTFHRRPYRLIDHIDRLYRSLDASRMDIGLSKEALVAIANQLIGHNARFLEEGGELGLVQFVTAGEVPTYAGMMGRAPRTTPTVCVHTFPLLFARYARKLQTGAHLVTPSIRQVPPQCYQPHMKCRSRMHYHLAEKEAQRVDPEAVALLLDLDGNVTETSSANFLMVKRGAIVSPPSGKILPGISRDTVMKLARELAIPFAERDIRVADIVSADEALITSTPFCLMPVTQINGTTIGDGKPGSTFRRLIDAWSQEVGLDIEAQIRDGAKKAFTSAEPA
jgi:branched-subunit amino acid aminotransferase/4-amino-4-deoxychorismate lyase